jgi:hypothetical protein
LEDLENTYGLAKLKGRLRALSERKSEDVGGKGFGHSSFSQGWPINSKKFFPKITNVGPVSAVGKLVRPVIKRSLVRTQIGQ